MSVLACCAQYYIGKKLCGITLEATIEEGNPHSGLKNVRKGVITAPLVPKFPNGGPPHTTHSGLLFNGWLRFYYRTCAH